MISLDLAFVIQVINFLVLMIILNVFLFKPIRKVIADRKAQIDGSRERAAVVDKEVQEKMALYEARLRDVKAKAGAEREVLRKEAQQEESAILEKARKEAADSLASIKSRVAKETVDAKEFLKEQSRSLSLEICQKVLGRSL
ncbi:ATP synthase F0 subunit B [Geobacter sulfurreducens]|uniref:ATP synthase subunit b n=1 Tax=Geobacter sulfurreducens (strain ATCC 51573 / DSM 12127 / PCA) TaxID=243231 RepID=Q74GY5_GEOSL|nr:ATP synthase F0 subunit B [Geobacter sulfurreducens]BET59949.1 ATP synthase F0 subunit B [Geobacter sp. 60473]AAR33443.1 ATP synthase F0, B' subunit [Geobacter sulfurreducens PCA]AJY69846.1 ATP synthase F0 subunit B' [Geobacter sulfurreducens]QVW35387.1 ATP synthase F0 subunit B [Geobacter sulfurreducens]UAC04211.1 ATP synthase F0 subunit B [Geobacter sulfurreducens]